jgi:hypothetical protein
MFGPFPLPYNGDVDNLPKSAVELRMNALSATIRNKSNWHINRLNPSIIAKWRQEAIAQHSTPDQFKFVVGEPAYYEKLRNMTIEVAEVDGVYRSAIELFPVDIKANFSRLVSVLADTPEKDKDWHPGSNNAVLDLVHPGLYLFISGTTRTIPVNRSEATGSVSALLDVFPSQYMSTKYQWIPTPVELDANRKPKLHSYINNLHPKDHLDLYLVLADMHEHLLPLFERVLVVLKYRLRQKINLSHYETYDE